MSATISLVMIVKNEARTLEACLESVKAIVDEWVIVDTGSTDGTQAVIQRYTSNAFTEVFEDFVTTKNKALALAKCDYILFMDADERLVSGAEKLRQYAEEGVDAVAGTILETSVESPTMTYQRYRLWRNKPEFRFAGPGVHEFINVFGKMIFDPGIRVFHDHAHRTGQSFVERQKFYVDKLKAHLKDHPDDERALFYLARTYREMNLPLLAVETYRRYLNRNGAYRDERWQAAYDAALCLKAQGEHDQAREFLDIAVSVDPRRAEAWLLLGDLEAALQDWDSALASYQKAAKLKLPSDVLLFVDPSAYNGRAKLAVAKCLEKLKRYREAEYLYREANPAKPDRAIISTLERLHDRQRLKWFFALGPTPEPLSGPMIETQGLGGVETTYIELPTELARLGHEVFVFCACDREHVFRGVRYLPYHSLNAYAALGPDVVVSSRWFEPLHLSPRAKSIVWLQDAHFANPAYPDIWQTADQIIVSSEWHRTYTAERLGEALAPGRLKIIPLGIRKELFGRVSGAKIKNRVIYSSNPDRGLFILKDLWPRLVADVPDITLTITYGWQGLKTWDKSEGWQRRVSDNERAITAWAEQAGNVRLTGRLSKRQLYFEMALAELCLYPNNFWETFFLGGLEMQASGTPMVTSNMGALPTTLCRHGNVLIDGDPFGEAYRDRFVESVVNLLSDRVMLTMMSDICRSAIATRPCDWSDIAKQWERVVFEL